MSKQKNIKIPLPSWNWWQTALFISIIIIAISIAVKLDSNQALELVKEVDVKSLSR